jgi:hypothetical protein
MHRSHRWAQRSLDAFVKTHAGKQALYGIIQGGVYEDLRDQSAAFINSLPFFGTAIGGSLGADKKSMHAIVAYTRSRVRDDRPVHLLGIGGVRDVFHGVRQGIDTFDCVHPTRLGRHGGVLVMTAHWNEQPWGEVAQTAMTLAAGKKVETLLRKELNRLVTASSRLDRLEASGEPFATVLLSKRKQKPGRADQDGSSESMPLTKEQVESRRALIEDKLRQGILDPFDADLGQLGLRGLPPPSSSLSSTAVTHSNAAPPGPTVREHINVSKGQFRNDPRPIDSKCGCYTCRNFSRAYLHHLFKARESLGGTLCTIHNVAFMNKLMADIRAGIETGTLDEVEKSYVHSKLSASVSGDSMGIGT